MNQDITAYLEAQPEDRRTVLATLIKLVTALFPDATGSIKYKMPTFVTGDGWVAIANQKHYVSLYTCEASHIEGFKARQPKIKTGKGCINLKPKDDLPINDLKEVIRLAMTQRP